MRSADTCRGEDCGRSYAAADLPLTAHRALVIISRMREWWEPERPQLSEADTREKARMIARWGLEGDAEKLAEAETALRIDTEEAPTCSR